MKQIRYIEVRKKGLRELMSLEAHKFDINKDIRKIKKELQGFDRALLND